MEVIGGRAVCVYLFDDSVFLWHGASGSLWVCLVARVSRE
jgi:hypothetical protein